MNHPTFNPFLIGCIGALAPEIIRLYKLRFSPTVRWSWGYLVVSAPFVLLGGFMAYILDPATSYAAFYTGVSTPFIVTTLAKDSERDGKVIQRLTRENNQLEAELSHLQQNPSVFSTKTAAAISEPSSPPPTVETSNTSNRSSLRSASLTPGGTAPPAAQHSTNSHFSQSRSRRLRPRPSKWRTFQSFLKAL